MDSISEEEYGFVYLRPTENIVTDADKEPGNFMQVIAIVIIDIKDWGRAMGICSIIGRSIACFTISRQFVIVR